MTTQYSKQELCDAVYTAVCSAGRPLSRLEICRAIGRAKSPHIIAMIEDLTAGGWFVKSASVNKRGLNVWVYAIGKKINGAGACDGQ